MNNNFVVYIWLYFIGNIPLLFIFRKTTSMLVMHRIVSTVDISLFTAIISLSFYQIETLFVIFSPIILLIACPISYGINEELSKEDKAVLVTGVLPSAIKIIFIEIVTFPFYYFVKSWKPEFKLEVQR